MRHHHIVGFEPAGSPIYSGGQMGKHRLIGIGPGFAADANAFATIQRLAPAEGVLAGVTSGAGLWMAENVLHQD